MAVRTFWKFKGVNADGEEVSLNMIIVGGRATKKMAMDHALKYHVKGGKVTDGPHEVKDEPVRRGMQDQAKGFFDTLRQAEAEQNRRLGPQRVREPADHHDLDDEVESPTLATAKAKAGKTP